MVRCPGRVHRLFVAAGMAALVTSCSGGGSDGGPILDAPATEARGDATEPETVDPGDTGSDTLEYDDTEPDDTPDESASESEADDGFDLGDLGFDPDADDFVAETVEFIEDPAGDVAAQTAMTFSDVECGPLASLDVGTTYQCRAAGSDGEQYTFTAEITGDQSFEITGVEPTD